jgi:hypothetical protein
MLGLRAPASGPDLGERLIVLVGHGGGLLVRRERVWHGGVRLSRFEEKVVLRVRSALLSDASSVL